MKDASLADPRLRRALEQVDQLKRELKAEKIRSGHLRFELVKALPRTADAKRDQQDHRASC